MSLFYVAETILTKIRLSIYENVLLKLENVLKKDLVTLKLLFPAYFLEMNVGLSTELSLAKLMIFWMTNVLHGFCFIDQKYGWTRENGMVTLNLYFKDNVHLTEQGNAKLASSILATINGNITLPARGISIITNYENAVSFNHIRMMIFHRYLFQHFQITVVLAIMLVILSLIL